MRTGLGQLLLLVALAPLVRAADPVFEAALSAHGGLGNWQDSGAVEYDLHWQFGDAAPLIDHQLIDLQSRRVLIVSDSYTIGYDGQVVWIKPTRAALRMPASRPE